jgi:hypothetical protein
MLRRLHRTARKLNAPLVLCFDEQGLTALISFPRGCAERPKAEGPEAAWLGKGAGTAVRLAGALALLTWSGAGGSAVPGPIGREPVEAAVGLWEGYFRPHAQALFDRAVPTGLEQRVRRTARWLKHGRQTEAARRHKARCIRPIGDGRRDGRLCYRLEEAASAPSTAGPRTRGWAAGQALASQSGAGSA